MMVLPLLLLPCPANRIRFLIILPPRLASNRPLSTSSRAWVKSSIDMPWFAAHLEKVFVISYFISITTTPGVIVGNCEYTFKIEKSRVASVRPHMQG
jgi:hypothetical protein